MGRDRFQKFYEEVRTEWIQLGKPSNGTAAYTYFISDGELVKIGLADEIKSRMCHLQNGNGRDLHLIEYVKWECREEARIAERHLHRLFSDNRKRGEWFDIHRNEWACDFIFYISHYYEHDYEPEWDWFKRRCAENKLRGWSQW